MSEKKVHYDYMEINRSMCTLSMVDRMSDDPDKVTCKRCLKMLDPDGQFTG